MAWFIVGIILLAIGIIGLVESVKGRKELAEAREENQKNEQISRYDRMTASEREDAEKWWILISGAVGGLALLLGLLTVGLDSSTVVPSRNVGIPVTFGQVGSPLDSGLHFVAPWTDVVKIDATTQNINRNADETRWNDPSHPVCTAVLVRLASGASACVDITSQWNVSSNAPAASSLWTQYRGNTGDTDKTNDSFIGNLTVNVLDREIQRDMNTAFATYNPIVVGNDNQAVNTPLDLKTYSAAVLADLRASVPAGINVTEFLISHVHFDRATQDKINQLAQAKADTQIALQKELTAKAQKQANDLLASLSSNNPGVMFQNCINLLRDLAASGQLGSLPVNSLQCVAGSGGAPVIVSSAKP